MTAQRKRARRRAGTRVPVTEGYDGPYWVGGLMSRRWAERHSRAEWPDELARMIAHARQQADAGSKVHAGIAAELERELALLKRPDVWTGTRAGRIPTRAPREVRHEQTT